MIKSIKTFTIKSWHLLENSPTNREMAKATGETQATTFRLPNWSVSAMKKIPLEFNIPKRIKQIKADETAITQPQPPSGGTGFSCVHFRSGLSIVIVIFCVYEVDVTLAQSRLHILEKRVKLTDIFSDYATKTHNIHKDLCELHTTKS